MKLFILTVGLLCAAIPCSAQSFTLDAVAACPGLGNSHDVVLLGKTYYVQFDSGAWSPVGDDAQNGGYVWSSTVTYYDYGTGETGTLGGSTLYTSPEEAGLAAQGIFVIQGHGSAVSFYLHESGFSTEVCEDNRGSVTLEFVTPSGVGDTPSASALEVHPNYPNPFTGTTAFDVSLPRDADVVLQVYDAAGRRVHTTRLGSQAAGLHTLSFDGRDDAGRELRSGVYFAKVSALGETVTRKIVLVR